MPFPDAKYPPERKVMDEWRLALQTLAADGCLHASIRTASEDCRQFGLAVYDCATTALQKERTDDQ